VDHLTFIALLVATSGWTPATPRQEIAGMKCFHEGASVRLTGIVTHRMFYGAPNYGETPKTDRRVRVAILRLESPITPCELTEFDRDDRKLGEPVREVQVDAWPSQLKTGARRTFAGTIHAATIGPDYLDYVLDVP
jgi:hypothetical protein